jgi:hypothetical protein
MADRRLAVQGVFAGLLVLCLAAGASAATKALYDGTADDRQLGGWGNGKLAVSTDVKLDSVPALEVTAKGLCEGGRYVLSPAQDLTTFLRAPSTSFLVLKVRLGSAASAMRMMGMPGADGGATPGMMQGGQGMMPGMMQGGQGMMPGMMQGGQGMMPGMMQGGQGMMPGMMQGGQGTVPGVTQGGQRAPGGRQGRRGARGAGGAAAPAGEAAPAATGDDEGAALPNDGTSFFAQLPGLPGAGAARGNAGLPQLPGEGPPVQARGAAGAAGAAMPGMMGGQGMMPGMMGGQGMMPGMMQGGQGMMPGMMPGMMGGQGMMPGMMQGGQGAPGAGAAGGGGFPGFGGMRGRTGGASRPLSQIRVLLVTDKGQLDAGAFDVESLKKTDDWSEIKVPFSKMRGKGGQTGAKLQAIVLTGNGDGKFYVGSIEVTSG